MDHGKPASPLGDDCARVLNILEDQLTQLDQAGAHKAAAHLDAAIQQLRRDRKAKAWGERCAQAAADTSTLAPIIRPFSETFAQSQVFLRKANPANSR